MQNNIKFLAQKTAPDPRETTYWVNTTVDPKGGTILYHTGTEWKPINSTKTKDIDLSNYITKEEHNQILELVVQTLDDFNKRLIELTVKYNELITSLKDNEVINNAA